MAFVSVTRLRIRSIRFLPAFALDAWRTRRQAARAEGFLGGSLLGGRGRAFRTMTAWENEASMRAYMTGGAHRTAMPRLMHWCDEASVTHWIEPGEALPSWTEAVRRMRAEGRISKVRHPSPRHADMSFDDPRLTGTAIPIRPAAGRV